MTTLNDLNARDGGRPRHNEEEEPEKEGCCTGTRSCEFNHKIPNPEKHPTQETIWDMWKYTCCPDFHIRSFTFVLVILLLAVYLIEVITSGIMNGQLNKFFFLGPEFSTQQLFGMRMPWLIQEQYQVQRLFLPVFLHFGFSHLCINLLIICMTGFLIEKQQNALFMFAQFMIVQITGSIFACYCSSQYGVGTDIIIMGYLGTVHAMFAWDWDNKGPDFCQKLCAYLCVVGLTALVVVLMVMAGAQYANVAKSFNLAAPDLYGCLGGFITGLISAFIFMRKTICNDPNEANSHETKQRYLRIAGVIGLVAWFTLWTCLFALSGPIQKHRDFSPKLE